jgi:hypothetical protein
MIHLSLDYGDGIRRSNGSQSTTHPSTDRRLSSETLLSCQAGFEPAQSGLFPFNTDIHADSGAPARAPMTPRHAMNRLDD